MINASCRGYLTAQFMQPEPAKYSRGPNIEAQTFMQPEQGFYTHHPGRFVYIKDIETSELFSAPYEPVRAEADSFVFNAQAHQVSWTVVKNGVEVEMILNIDDQHIAELWTVKITNRTQKNKKLAIYPYFSVGYMSWMNQSASYDESLQAIVCKSITPYQKYPDYFKNKNLKDLSYLLAEKGPVSWECRQQVFEGEGGLHKPSGLDETYLEKGESQYEMPLAVMQYIEELNAGESVCLRFVFGPANNKNEIRSVKEYFLLDSNESFSLAEKNYCDYLSQSEHKINLASGDNILDSFVNSWLPRQVFYHGDVNRLSTDPQTRNYLQDALGMAYIDPNKTREALRTAMAQQHESGEMPDGILLHDHAQLKYINQVPHADHCVWLPLCLDVYLNETNNVSFLEERIPFSDSSECVSVYEHICRAMNWLIHSCDERGLSYIQQGDWCDPMNMVGYKGKGVSAWLSLASSYALKVSQNFCRIKNDVERESYFIRAAEQFNQSVNTHLWKDQWYARGITDDGRVFGTANDDEGKIFLNPQSWAMLCGAVSKEKIQVIIQAVDEYLASDYGVAMLAPAFTSMVEDIGRVTQKYPGSAENGSIYNHAAAFYAYALYIQSEEYKTDTNFSTLLADKAYNVLRKMIPQDTQDCIRRGQLPIFIPNYYRGAVKQFPLTAGRSSQLFNTGTVHWFMRCLVDGLFGLKGEGDNLVIQPHLPSQWSKVKVERYFRGARIKANYSRSTEVKMMRVLLEGNEVNENRIDNIQKNSEYHLDIVLPEVL